MIEVLFVLILAVVLFLLLRGSIFARDQATPSDPPASSAAIPQTSNGILRPRDHDMPYRTGLPPVSFADTASERRFSKRTGRIGAVRAVGLNDRGRYIRQPEVYPR